MTTSVLPESRLRDCINGEDDKPPEIEIVPAWIANPNTVHLGVEGATDLAAFLRSELVLSPSKGEVSVSPVLSAVEGKDATPGRQFGLRKTA